MGRAKEGKGRVVHLWESEPESAKVSRQTGNINTYLKKWEREQGAFRYGKANPRVV